MFNRISIDCAKPIRLIETYTISCLEQILRSYSTFNRGIQKILQPIRLIEPVLIIETQEYSAGQPAQDGNLYLSLKDT